MLNEQSGEVKLKPCPICGDQPVRNGRGGVGGVICPGISSKLAHRVQAYGATQTEADATWNTPPPTPPSDEARAREVGALRYLLNWADTNTRISTIMKTFTSDRVTTREHLESLYAALAAHPAPAGEDAR